MAAIKYRVKLAESERSRLNEVSHRALYKPSVRTVKRALALLKADEGLRDPETPSDNNAAERSLRHLVISRKISGGTRSEAGRCFPLRF